MSSGLHVSPHIRTWTTFNQINIRQIFLVCVRADSMTHMKVEIILYGIWDNHDQFTAVVNAQSDSVICDLFHNFFH